MSNKFLDVWKSEKPFSPFFHLSPRRQRKSLELSELPVRHSSIKL